MRPNHELQKMLATYNDHLQSILTMAQQMSDQELSAKQPLSPEDLLTYMEALRWMHANIEALSSIILISPDVSLGVLSGYGSQSKTIDSISENLTEAKNKAEKDYSITLAQHETKQKKSEGEITALTTELNSLAGSISELAKKNLTGTPSFLNDVEATRNNQTKLQAAKDELSDAKQRKSVGNQERNTALSTFTQHDNALADLKNQHTADLKQQLEGYGQAFTNHYTAQITTKVSSGESGMFTKLSSVFSKAGEEKISVASTAFKEAANKNGDLIQLITAFRDAPKGVDVKAVFQQIPRDKLSGLYKNFDDFFTNELQAIGVPQTGSAFDQLNEGVKKCDSSIDLINTVIQMISNREFSPFLRGGNHVVSTADKPKSDQADSVEALTAIKEQLEGKKSDFEGAAIAAGLLAEAARLINRDGSTAFGRISEMAAPYAYPLLIGVSSAAVVAAAACYSNGIASTVASGLFAQPTVNNATALAEEILKEVLGAAPGV